MIRAIAYALFAGLAIGYFWGCSVEKERFDSFRGATEALGRDQEKRSAQTAARQKSLKETSDEDWKKQVVVRDRELALARKRLSGVAGGSVLPPAPAGSTGNSRICFAAEEFNRGLGAALARLRERSLSNAQEGQRSADVAALCRDWSNQLAR